MGAWKAKQPYKEKSEPKQPRLQAKLSELLVTYDLLAKGYQVYTGNAADHTLIAFRDGELIRVHVRTGSFDYRGKLVYLRSGPPDAIYAVALHSERRISYFGATGEGTRMSTD